MTEIIAHRGASRAARENTVEAFALAVAMGADGIELDVRRSRDGHLVVHHDARIDGGAAIIDLDRSDLPDHIPDLHEALVACAGATGEIEITVNIEIKNDANEPDFDYRPVDRAHSSSREALAVAGPHRWLISSFDLAMVDAVVATGAGIATAWLVVDVPAGTVPLLTERGHRALHPWVGVARAVDRRRVPRGRNRRQHVDLRRPGTHARAHRVGRRRHLHERARHRPRRARRPLKQVT